MTDLQWRVVLAADEAGVSYKDAIKADLLKDPRVKEVLDVGVNATRTRPPTARGRAAARKIAAGEADRGILVCGTGMGVAIAANKVPGIRASVAHDSFSVERLVLSNDGQVLTRRAGHRQGAGAAAGQGVPRLRLRHLQRLGRKVDAITGYETGASDEAGSVPSC